MNISEGNVRIVVVGIGGRGVWAVEELFQDPNYELVALCEGIGGKLDFYKKSKDLEHIPGYGSLAECLENEEFDAVVVSTPDGHHAEVVIPALEAGKYVFVEKPLEVTEEKCRAIVEADKKAGGKTFVGFNLRFAPVYVKVKELIDQGAIGDILTIQADEFYDGGRTYFRRWNRLREIGGGLWVTKASHDFDIIYWMAGQKPVSVYALAELSYYKQRDDVPLYCGDCPEKDTCCDGFYFIKKGEIELLSEAAAEHGAPRPDLCLFNSRKDTFDHGIATVQFENGVFATYTCNVVAGFSNRRIRISGTKGTIDADLHGQKIILRKRDPSETMEIPVGGAGGGHGGAGIFILKNFYEFVKGLREPRVRPDEAMVAVLMGLAASRSGDESRQVKMCEFGL